MQLQWGYNFYLFYKFLGIGEQKTECKIIGYNNKEKQIKIEFWVNNLHELFNDTISIKFWINEEEISYPNISLSNLKFLK